MNGRPTLSSTVLAVSLVLAGAAHAAEPALKECVAAAEGGQKLRDDGKLTDARDAFITCASSSCPGVVAKQCGEWLEEVERAMPSVSFRVLDPHRRELVDVRIFLDGEKIGDTIDARARAVNPGDHTVRVERADGTSVEQRVIVRAGEKNRIVELAFDALPALAAPSASTSGATSPAAATVGGEGLRVPLLGWVGLGVGVLGGLGTYLFASSAKGDTDDLRRQCAPACDPSERDSIDQKLLFANVSLGVGAVGLGAGVVATVLANTDRPAKKEAPRSSVSLDLGPAAAHLRGTF